MHCRCVVIVEGCPIEVTGPSVPFINALTITSNPIQMAARIIILGMEAPRNTKRVWSGGGGFGVFFVLDLLNIHARLETTDRFVDSVPCSLTSLEHVAVLAEHPTGHDIVMFSFYVYMYCTGTCTCTCSRDKKYKRSDRFYSSLRVKSKTYRTDYFRLFRHHICAIFFSNVCHILFDFFQK